MNPEATSVTHLLSAWSAGDQAAGNLLITTVYRELKRLAASHLRQERPDHTLQPTALVHELYVKLLSGETIEWRDRGHFFAVAARQLRHIVIDYARNQRAQKRGGGAIEVTLDDVNASAVLFSNRAIELDQALSRLDELDQRSAQVVELRYFGGLTDNETAEALGISVATVKRDWEFGRAWLLKQLT